MLQSIYSVIIILHGLVHMWYVTLAQRWVSFEPDMGWTSNSWIFTNTIGDAATRTLATIVYSLSTLAFLIGGIGIFVRADWWTSLITGAAILSSIGILLFWDGSTGMLVQKGLIGLLINIALLVSLLLFNWPANQL